MSVTVNGSSGLTFNDGSTQNTSPFTGGLGFRNRIINGDFRIDQRNAGASVTNTSSVYTLDRWVSVNSASSKYTIQQNAGSVTPPAGFTNYLGITSSSSYSVGSGDYFLLRHMIEGFNVADLGWGTADAKTVTLSFWVRSSLTGTFSGSLMNSAENRAYPFAYTISSANTWEQKSITIAGDTTGTWLTTNLSGIKLGFSLGTGSTYSGTAGAWTGSTVVATTGSQSVVGTSGATFYITGVQLEKGSTATSFDYRPYGTELMLCQRYFYQHVRGVSQSLGTGFQFSASQLNLTVSLPVPMRTAPSLVASSGSAYYRFYRNSSLDDFDSFTLTGATTTTLASLYNDTNISGTAGQAGVVDTNNAAASLGFSAEL